MKAQNDYMEDIHTFGQWVKNQRKALGLTQADLAQRVACSKSMINKIESDLRSPTKPLIKLLALHLKIAPADYARFVHLAQPHLLVESDDLPNKQSTNININSQKTITTHPQPLTPLIGRESDVEAVSFFLQQTGTRLLTLTGPGGIGKTRLALAVATELQDKFSDGVYFVSLAPVRESAHVLSTIVQALGLKSMHNQGNDELLVTYLHEKAILLILDNFEQALPATKAIAELLALTSYLKVLVTSRAVLRLSGEYEYVVQPLDVPNLGSTPDLDVLALSPAIQLFVQRAKTVLSSFALTDENANSVAEICARLDGLPLAIELAAARCKVLSPKAILTRLRGAMGGTLMLLTGGFQDLPARHQTIRQTIEWSYNLLNAREQILFRRLGIFVGGFTLDVIEYLCSELETETYRRLQPASALDTAISLMDQSLLRQVEGLNGEPRFFVSETLREYALEVLISNNELEMMHHQHAVFFLHWIEFIGPKLYGVEQEENLKQLDVDYNNIREALTWSCAHDIEMALQMAGMLWEYWLARGYLSEGRMWLSDILSHPETKSLQSLRARALNGAGLLTSVQGDQETANQYLQEGLRLFRELNDQKGEAWVLNHLGQTLSLSNQPEQAVPFLEKSLQLFRALGDNLHSAWVLSNLGDVSLRRGDIDRARQFLSDAHGQFSTLNHKRGMAVTVSRLARSAELSRDFVHATALFTKSLHLFDEIGDREGYSWTLHNLGVVTNDSGQNSQAIKYLIESLRSFDKLNDKWGFVSSLLELAKAVRDLRLEQAAALFGAADVMMKGFSERKSSPEYIHFIKILTEAQAQFDATAWAKGKTLSSEKVLAWILEQSFPV
jgi:predicted ATPase/transcriptional regulator with XRE-family HTH domain